MPATWIEVGNIVGPPGSAGGDTNIVGEVPSGLINGTNADYTTASNFATNTLAVFLNGVRQKAALDYNVTGLNTFQMVAPPLTGDVLTVDYIVAAVTSAPIYIGAKARLVPLSNGAQIEVQDLGGTWIQQAKWTE